MSTVRGRDPRHPARSGITTSTVSLALIGAVAIFVLLLSRSFDPIAGAPATSTPATSQELEESPYSSEGPSEPVGTSGASFNVEGEVPGPDATSPPGTQLIPGLTIQAVNDLMRSQGLTCQSSIGGFPGTGGGYTLGCELHIPESHAKYAMAAVYWTLDGVSDVEISLYSDGIGVPITDPEAGRRVLAPIAALLGGDAARSWVESKVDDPSCTHGACTFPVGSTVLVLEVGVGGGRQLSMAGASPG